jgi:hypothetical protein
MEKSEAEGVRKMTASNNRNFEPYVIVISKNDRPKNIDSSVQPVISALPRII